jgi:hypothetical protein
MPLYALIIPCQEDTTGQTLSPSVLVLAPPRVGKIKSPQTVRVSIAMSTKTVVAATIVVCGVLLLPMPATACSCVGTPATPAALRSSDLVFVGTVVSVSSPFRTFSRNNPDGSVTAGVVGQPSEVRFHVVRASRRVAISLSPKGQTWLIYATVRNGVVATHKCTRSRLREEAEQDIRYLDGVQRGEKLGIVYGQVLKKTTEDGKPVLKAVDDGLLVVGIVGGQRFAALPDRWGPFQLVLPPGDAQIFVERNGVVVSGGTPVRVTDGELVPLQLIAEYEKH